MGADSLEIPGRQKNHNFGLFWRNATINGFLSEHIIYLHTFLWSSDACLPLLPVANWKVCEFVARRRSWNGSEKIIAVSNDRRASRVETMSDFCNIYFLNTLLVIPIWSLISLPMCPHACLFIPRIHISFKQLFSCRLTSTSGWCLHYLFFKVEIGKVSGSGKIWNYEIMSRTWPLSLSRRVRYF